MASLGGLPESPESETEECNGDGSDRGPSPEKLASMPVNTGSPKGRSGRARASVVGFAMEPTARGRMSTINQDITGRITHRFEHEVRAAESQRSELKSLLDVNLADDREVAETVKHDLDSLLSRCKPSRPGSETADADRVSWDKLLSSDIFQKKLRFLCDHAQSGFFIHQYGADNRYEGEFLYGMRHGKGTHEFRSEVYDGEWKWDKRHGWGTLSLGDGTSIKGDWKHGKPDGFASILDKKGTVSYDGEFRDGKRHGLGRQIFESGDIYDGGWKEGRLHDRGVYYFTNGDKLYGMWKEGIYDGIGVFHYADGSISRRVYKDGRLMSVQDYQHSSQKFGKTLSREDMQRHTKDNKFPRDVFLLNSA